LTNNLIEGFQESLSDYEKANQLNLFKIFDFFNFNINQFSRKMTCPFPDHSNGQERSASFIYYSNTNSFYCFGCKISGGPVKFIVNYKQLTEKAAVQFLLSLDNQEVCVIAEKPQDNYKLLDFSKKLRIFAQQSSIENMEKISYSLDKILTKYKLEPDGLEKLIVKLKELME